jgi:hypothetical protein
VVRRNTPAVRVHLPEHTLNYVLNCGTVHRTLHCGGVQWSRAGIMHAHKLGMNS